MKKIWIVLLLMLVGATAFAADQKTTQLTATTTPASTDIIAMVVDPGGTPVSRKVTLANLATGFGYAANVVSFLGAADYAAMRTALGVAIGVNVQAYDADLTTYAGITPSANVQTFLGSADYAAMRTNLGLVIGTNVEAAFADPNANTVAGWDDTDNALTSFIIGSGLSYDHASHTLSATTASDATTTTKGIASFNASDFDVTSGAVTIDYANGQTASGSQHGFLSDTDWTTFNNKQAAITRPVSGPASATAGNIATYTNNQTLADGGTPQSIVNTALASPAAIGSSTPAAGTFTKVDVTGTSAATTGLSKDGSNNLVLTDAVTGSKTLAQLVPASVTNLALNAGEAPGTLDGANLVGIPVRVIGSTLTVANAYYVNGAGTIAKAKADASATMPAICVADTTTTCLWSGIVTTTGLTSGAVYYVSAGTAGALTATPPATSTNLVQRVGVALSTTQLLVMPSLDVGTVQ